MDRRTRALDMRADVVLLLYLPNKVRELPAVQLRANPPLGYALGLQNGSPVSDMVKLSAAHGWG